MKRFLFGLAALASLSVNATAGFPTTTSAEATSPSEEVTAKFKPEGVTRIVGGYRPIRAVMNQEASIVEKAPDGLEAPKYGMLEFGDRKFPFILDQPEEGDPKLYVDTNADGDLTNDPEATWKVTKRGESLSFNGSAAVDLGEGNVGKINLYRFDPKDEERRGLTDTMLYYADFGTEFTFQLDGNEFSTFVSGAVSAEDSLWIDRDENGKQSYRFERAVIGKPFNFTGTTYVFSLDGASLKLDKSDEELPQAQMPPNLVLGQQCLPFTGTVMQNGEEVSFPKSFAGKIVMLDFWATWCGPCIGEIPNMKAAYDKWHDEGFEILGISFDSEGADEKVTKFLEENELPWPQIYEGKGWETSIGMQHDVSGIPFVLLVDADTGEIIGTSRECRGEKLVDYIGTMLEKKKNE